jgi:hypothetical protein
MVQVPEGKVEESEFSLTWAARVCFGCDAVLDVEPQPFTGHELTILGGACTGCRAKLRN